MWSDVNYQNIKDSLVDGDNTLVLYDAAGNSTEYNFVLDLVAPTITVKDTSESVNGIYTKISFKLGDDHLIDKFQINESKIVDVTDNNLGDANYHAIKNSLKEGNNTITLYDTAGNSTVFNFKYTSGTVVSNLDTFRNAIANGGVVYLANDISLSTQYDITADTTLTGANILRDSDYTGSLFKVSKGTTLNIKDIEVDSNNQWNINKTSYESSLNSSTKVTNTESFITYEDGHPIAEKPMIEVYGKLVLENAIIENYAGKAGASVIRTKDKSAEVVLKNTTIQNVTNANNAAVASLNEGGTLKIENGTVIKNCNSGGNGGLIEARNNAQVTMNGGEITNNTGVNSNGTVIMLYNASFIMNGGLISGNSSVIGASNSRNAAIYGHSNSRIYINNGTISNNTGSRAGGIDTARNNAYLEINGGKVINNVNLKPDDGIPNFNDIYWYNKTNTVITGGTFTQDITGLLSDDKQANYDNGQWTVVDK